MSIARQPFAHVYMYISRISVFRERGDGHTGLTTDHALRIIIIVAVIRSSSVSIVVVVVS